MGQIWTDSANKSQRVPKKVPKHVQGAFTLPSIQPVHPGMRLLLLSWSIRLPEVRALDVGRHRYRCAALLADQHAFDVLDELVRLEPLVQDMGPDSVFLAAVPALDDEEVSRREVGQLQ